ncbi:MAG TPA: hypothetical protein VGO57_07475, partial [Verrucomicrobiae bacterium]
PSTRLILAGRETRSLGSPATTWREVEALLPQWQCWSPDAAIAPAITLAAELGKSQANILVLTDHKPADEKVSNPRLEWHAFGEPLDNLAIVNASRTAFGDADRCLLEIANFSGGAHTARLSVQTGSNVVQTSLITLAAHENQRLVFNIPSATPLLHAGLAGDALAADNAVQLLPPVRKRVRVQVALTNAVLSELANRTLDATGLRATLSENPELVIRDTDTVANSNSWNLCWSTAAATNAYTGPFIVDDSHPLARGIALEGVVWAAAAVTNSPGDMPVIFAGNVPLLSVREDLIGRRHLTLNLNPDLSTVRNTPDWPILFWNLLSWRIAEMPGLKESNLRLGAEVNLKTGDERVTIRQPDGGEKTFPKTGGELALETPVTGIYSVILGTTTNEFSVNALAADESDLSACASGQWGKWGENTERRLEEASVVWIFGLLALGLLSWHLYLVTKAKGTA